MKTTCKIAHVQAVPDKNLINAPSEKDTTRSTVVSLSIGQPLPGDDMDENIREAAVMRRLYSYRP